MNHIKKQGKTIGKKVGSFCLMLTMLLSIFSMALPAWAMGETANDELLKIDPYFPTTPADVPYTFSVPTLEDRLTLSADGKTATLFAPYVTKESGWYDANKNFQNDWNLCWAAASSNLLAWYLDVCDKTGANSTVGYERDVQRIFDNFRTSWDPAEGFDPMQGLAWYFTGNTLSGKPSNLVKPNSGGYLPHIEHNGTWSVLDAVNHYPIVGNYRDSFPFIDEESGLYYKDSPFYNHESFSKTIITQLHYGASALSVLREQGPTRATGHAITLWGCSYDVATGLISKIYVTDSDDEAYRGGSWLKEITVKAAVPDEQGIWLEGYTLPGNATPFRKVASSTMLFAPGVVKVAGDRDAYIDAVPTISSVTKQGNEAVVNASLPSKPQEQLEYGYSTQKRSSSVTNWQTSNRFALPTEEEVYFFVRVRETAEHKAGGVSKPYVFRLRAKPTKLPECPLMYKPYLEGIAAKYPNWQFEFYDMGITFDEALELEQSAQKNRLDASFPASYRTGNAQADGTYGLTKEALAYFMDPRNAMTEERLFVFAGDKALEESYYAQKFTLSKEQPKKTNVDSIYKDAQSRYNMMASISGNLARARVFRIPVYRDMPSVCHLPDYKTGDAYQSKYGDIVVDGNCNLADYQALLQMVTDLDFVAVDGAALIAADLNGDTAVDAFDAALLDRAM